MRKIKRPTPISPEQWEQVGDFVTEHISQAPEAASDTLHGLNVLSLSRYAVWILDQGLDLDPEYVFDKGLVFDHCGTYSPDGLKGATLRAHIARLRRIVSNFNPDLLSAQPVNKKTAKKSQPYTEIEVEKLVEWAAQDRRRKTLLALCLGAGLRTSEAVNVRWEDIEVDEIGVLVSAGSPRRTVPVLARFDGPLREAKGNGYVLHDRVEPLPESA